MKSPQEYLRELEAQIKKAGEIPDVELETLSQLSHAYQDIRVDWASKLPTIRNTLGKLHLYLYGLPGQDDGLGPSIKIQMKHRHLVRLGVSKDTIEFVDQSTDLYSEYTNLDITLNGYLAKLFHLCAAAIKIIETKEDELKTVREELKEQAKEEEEADEKKKMPQQEPMTEEDLVEFRKEVALVIEKYNKAYTEENFNMARSAKGNIFALPVKGGATTKYTEAKKKVVTDMFEELKKGEVADLKKPSSGKSD